MSNFSDSGYLLAGILFLLIAFTIIFFPAEKTGATPSATRTPRRPTRPRRREVVPEWEEPVVSVPPLGVVPLDTMERTANPGEPPPALPSAEAETPVPVPGGTRPRRRTRPKD